jgi:hypothetical protein
MEDLGFSAGETRELFDKAQKARLLQADAAGNV